MVEILEGGVMTNEQINITIAEACGWREVFLNQNNTPWGFNIGFNYSQRIPDYCNDLNAMHEAEMVIKKDSNLWKCYESFLARIVSGDCGMFHITANQRAEAFLKTIGKWE